MSELPTDALLSDHTHPCPTIIEISTSKIFTTDTMQYLQHELRHQSPMRAFWESVEHIHVRILAILQWQVWGYDACHKADRTLNIGGAPLTLRSDACLSVQSDFHRGCRSGLWFKKGVVAAVQ
jgi:hypothetical protein